MQKITLHIVILLTLIMANILCGCKNTDKAVVSQPQEDLNAKKMLQGIWVNDDDGSVVMKVKGDSIIYADTTLTSVTFSIYGDTLVTKSLSEARYPIIKQTEHIFQFTNASGDVVNLVKSDNPDDTSAFLQKGHNVVQINQGQLIKRDSVLFYKDKKIHAYVQVNPSTYKVVIRGVNESGMLTDNIYYDNIIHIAAFDGNRRIYSSNIVKQDFSRLVPKSFLNQSILSDITINGIGEDGVHFLASVLQPNSQTSYVIQISVSFDGKVSKKLN